MPSHYCPARRTPAGNKKPRAFPLDDAAALIWDPWGESFASVKPTKKLTDGVGQTDYAVPIGRQQGGGADLGVIIRSDNRDPRNPLQSIASAPDGESQTFLLGEKRLRTVDIGTDRGDDNEGYTSGWSWDTVRDTSVFRPPMPDPGTKSRSALDGCGTSADRRDVTWTDIDGNRRGPRRTCASVFHGDWRFGSSHPNGFNVAMADGSIRLLSYNIDMDVFLDLGNRDDGNAASDFD